MNVSDTDRIMSLIQWLRSNIYSGSYFRIAFEQQLFKYGYINIKFEPDSLGGWTIYSLIDLAALGKAINVDGIPKNTSELHIPLITKALYDTLELYDIGPFRLNTASPKDIPNIINVIVSGDSSIVIKI